MTAPPIATQVGLYARHRRFDGHSKLNHSGCKRGFNLLRTSVAAREFAWPSYVTGMEASLQNSPSQQLTVCNAACRYAEPMRGEYIDWIWCTHPCAADRLKNSSFECVRFEPALALRPAAAVS